jgi:hypothetical protein
MLTTVTASVTMFTKARLKKGTKTKVSGVARLKDQNGGHRITLKVHKVDREPAPKKWLERTESTPSNQSSNKYQRFN